MDPVRTCVGCRRRDLRQNLVRAVSQNGNLTADPKGIKAGRGVWFHFECTQLVLDRSGFTKALGAVNTAEFEAWHRQAREDAGNTMSSSK